eukprot:TRINITY_DN1863_c0_g1_i2.p1 TRINITY_DN1863_c0_g1~~TRINITY_DN1863_c0_g1_i2.p1  ORF type:complete len:186 (+),score=56.34 TRINITY_DN1863_c0_g1_i2:507-1064(+)
MSLRHFGFIGQTYFYDHEGNEIPLPPTDHLETFVAENSSRIQRIVMSTRSVHEEEITNSSNSECYEIDPGKAVRGFINLIAYVIDYIDEETCRVQILCDMDVGGYIPEWIKTIIAHYNANGFMKIKQYIEQTYIPELEEKKAKQQKKEKKKKEKEKKQKEKEKQKEKKEKEKEGAKGRRGSAAKK